MAVFFNSMKDNNTSTTSHPKSMGVSILLTLFFGPFGMLYSTITGAFIMFIIDIFIVVFALFFGFLTLIGFVIIFALLITWPVQIFWGAMAVKDHNTKHCLA